MLEGYKENPVVEQYIYENKPFLLHVPVLIPQGIRCSRAPILEQDLQAFDNCQISL